MYCRAKQFLGVVILQEIRGFYSDISWFILKLRHFDSLFFEYSVWYHIVLNLLFIWRFDTPTFNKCIKKEKLDCFYKKKCAWKVNFNADQELMWIVSNRQQLIIWYWWKSQCVSDVGTQHLIDDSCESILIQRICSTSIFHAVYRVNIFQGWKLMIQEEPTTSPNPLDVNKSLFCLWLIFENIVWA